MTVLSKVREPMVQDPALQDDDGEETLVVDLVVPSAEGPKHDHPEKSLKELEQQIDAVINPPEAPPPPEKKTQGRRR